LTFKQVDAGEAAIALPRDRMARDRLILLAIGVVLVVGTFFASRGITVIDEIIYLVGATAFQATGSLMVDNGYTVLPYPEVTFGAFFSAREDGLLGSQYPFGQTVFHAVLHPVLGPRGLYVLHALAAVVTLFATYAVALRLFADRQVALWSCLLLAGGTFLMEYVYGYWPHMTSVAAVMVSLALALKAFETERAFGPAALAGLALGAAIVLRIDSLLLLPVLAVLALVVGRRLGVIIAGGAVGLLPAVLCLSWSNHVKFNTWNPLSYGHEGGGTSLTSYLPLLAVGVAGCSVLVLWRLLPSARRYVVWGSVAVAVVTVLAVPQVRGMAVAFVTGFTVLIVDMTATVQRHAAIQAQPDGTMLFWGIPKKALGQSLPWIGLLPLLALPTLKEHRRAIGILAVMCLIWITPFALRSWHGGLGGNMRYFLPILPVLCILGALLVRSLAPGRAFLYAAIAGCLLSTVWVAVHPSAHAGASQILSLYVLTASAWAAVAALVVPGMLRVGAVAFGVGLGVAVANLMTDVTDAQKRRADIALVPDFETRVAGPALVFDHLLMSAFSNPDQVMAMSPAISGPRPEMVLRALDKGMAVALPGETAQTFLADHEALEIVPSSLGLPPGFVEVQRR